MSNKIMPEIVLPSMSDPDAWEEYIPLDEMEAPDIPARLLPDVFCDFAAALAHSTETPEALSFMTILGVISTCLAKQFVISPKSDWYEPINIYTLIALPPANNKSLILSTCTKPLKVWEAEKIANEGFALKRARSEYKTQEKIIEVLRVKAAKFDNAVEQAK